MNILIDNHLEQDSTAELADLDSYLKGYVIPVASHSIIKGDFGVFLSQRITFDNFVIRYLIFDVHKPTILQLDDDTPGIPILFSIKGALTFDLRCYDEDQLSEGQFKILSATNLIQNKILTPGEYHLFQLNISKKYLSDFKSSYPKVLNELFLDQKERKTNYSLINTIIPLKAILRIRSITGCKEVRAAGRSLIESSTSQLIIYLLDEWTNKKNYDTILNKKDTQALEAVKAYIINNLGSKNTISALGRRFGIAETNLKSNFKLMYKTTIHNFVTDSKIEMAKLLLEEGEDIPVIADKVGYPEASNFTRVFKRITGSTPAYYRNNCPI